MRKGYKNTSIGEIPIDWKITKLGDYLDYIQPTKYTTNDINETGSIPVLTANKAFVLGYTDESENIFTDIPVIIFDDFTTDSKFVDFNFKVRSSALKILVQKRKDIDINYLYESLKSINYQSVEHKRYWISEYQYLKIPLPPLPEQQKIAEILSTVDAKIDLITQRISQTQDLKKGLMQRLLTKGIGHTEFKDSPLGEIPKSWEVKMFSEIIKHSNQGVNTTTEGVIYSEKGFKVIRSNNISENIIDFNDVKFVDNKTYLRVKDTCKPKKGDVLYCNIGSALGSASIYKSDEEVIINWNVFRIQPNNELVNNEYLTQILNYMKAEMRKMSTQSTMPFISGKALAKVKFTIPSIEEQTQIASILSTVDSKLAVLQNKKTHYQDLKKGLMQQLLTGKVRVTGLIKEVV